MKMRSVIPMRIAKAGYIVMSILFCAAGVLFIVRPEISTEVIGIAAGIVMLIFGAIKLIGYFSRDLFRLAFQFDLECGVLFLILGAVVLLNPGSLMFFICAVLGIATLLDGIFKIRIALDSRQFGIRRWWLILAIAIATVIVGSALVFDSAQNGKFLTVLLGISLVFEGLLNLYTAASTVLIIKHQQPDIPEADYYTL